MDRDRLHRIRVIHHVLDRQCRLQTKVSYSDLVQSVREHLNQQVGAKTIQRDLATMRDELRLPVVYDRRGRTFRYTRQVSLQQLDLTVISSLDLGALLIGRQALQQFEGTPWHSGLRETFGRMLDAMPQGLLNQYQSLIDKVRFAGAMNCPVDPALWHTILSGLDEQTTLAIVYRSGTDGQTKERLVDPYGLVIVDRQWQLIAWDHRAQIVRTFLLQRIRSLSETPRAFRIRNGFTLDAYLQDAIAGQQSTGKRVKVKLRFTKEATPAGEAQIWHPHEKRSYDRQGRLVMEFQTAALFKVEREVLAWGGKVQVIAPFALRQNVYRKAMSIVRCARSWHDALY